MIIRHTLKQLVKSYNINSSFNLNINTVTDVIKSYHPLCNQQKKPLGNMRELFIVIIIYLSITTNEI